MARRIGLSVGCFVLAIASACRSSLPTPEIKAHPPTTTRYIEVPYPPPAARAEIVTAKPRDGAVWVDGEWSWQGKQWVWESGGWVIPPDKAYFAPWIAFRQSNGKLFFAPGAWHRDDDQMLPKPALLALAQSGLDQPPGDSPRTMQGDAGR
jgi:hypothetical protein